MKYLILIIYTQIHVDGANAIHKLSGYKWRNLFVKIKDGRKKKL